MAIIKAISSHAPIKTVLDYVIKNEKVESRLISGVGCSPDTAKEEMEATKELYGKTGGRTYKHFVQSFAPGEEITPQKAHEIATELVHNTSFFKGYEVLIATHEDKKHIHSHFIVNSVNYENGQKFQMSSKDLQKLKDNSDQLCRENGLSICEKGKCFDGSIRQDVVAWVKEKYQYLKSISDGEGRKSYVCDMKTAIENAICKATTVDEYKGILLESGITVNWKETRKHITYIDAEGKKVRDSNLKKTFNLDADKDSLLRKFEENRERLVEGNRNDISKHYIVSKYKTNFYTEIQEVMGRKIEGQQRVLDNVNAKIKQADDSIRKMKADIEKWTEQKTECSPFHVKLRFELQDKIEHGEVLVASIQENRDEYLLQHGFSSIEDIEQAQIDLQRAENIYEKIEEKRCMEEGMLESLQKEYGKISLDENSIEEAREELQKIFEGDFSEEMFKDILEEDNTSDEAGKEEVISLDEGKSRN